jgi:hypothetical protein
MGHDHVARFIMRHDRVARFIMHQLQNKNLQFCFLPFLMWG